MLKQILIGMLSVVLLMGPWLCGVAGADGADPFPLNRGTIYEYSDDNIPDICFFPAEKAKWDGYKVMAADWKKLTDFQKEAFISEAAEEIERNEDVTVDIKDGWKVLIAMNEGIKALEKDAPGVAKDQTMLRFLYDSLKGTDMVAPKPELVT